MLFDETHTLSTTLRHAHCTAPPFEPVPVQPRRDGWTPERQRGFIEALAATACVEDAALDFAAGHLKAAVFSRAIHGVPVPHYHKGELVGEHRRHNDRLAMFVMNHYGMCDAEEIRDRSVRYIRHLGWLTDGVEDGDGGDG